MNKVWIISIQNVGPRIKYCSSTQRLYSFLAPYAYSVLVFGALFCTIVIKFFHAWRYSLTSEFFGWIIADISVLLTIEIILTVICVRWPHKWVTRAANTIAAVVCTWSVMNAGWLIRTGTQILPAELLPLFRDPINILWIVSVNLIKMPKASIVLLVPSVLALVFFFSVLAKPQQPHYNRKFFLCRIIISLIIIIISISVRILVFSQDSSQVAALGLYNNCQLRAIMSLILSDSGHLVRADFTKAKREIPTSDRIRIPLKQEHINHNIIIVILEGIQYNYTSLHDRARNLTPYLVTLAQQGIEFINARSTITHTTKALFALLTGRFPSASQDIAETIPVKNHYASIATILSGQLGFRTAFFQSAKGNFEARPGLVYNLGFDKFWARDDLNDPNSFLGYLGCDEFSMLEPIIEWIKADKRPFLLTVLCSVSHDPYEVPQWFAKPADEPIERYRQTILYTDKFLAALDVELANLNLTDETILCVIGDHGEAFGEHGLLGHERIAFDEVLRIPWVMRAPFWVEEGTKVKEPVSSVDLTPTLLSLMGFNINGINFDGMNICADVPDERKVFFSGWMQQGPAGFVKNNNKFTYNPSNKSVFVYHLVNDPHELDRIEMSEQQAQAVADEIIAWQKNSIFRINQNRTGKTMLFNLWLCSWTGRVSSVKYRGSN